MATTTPEKDPVIPVASLPQYGEAHAGPVARLLARVSKWNSEYAEFQMESGIWRKLAL